MIQKTPPERIGTQGYLQIQSNKQDLLNQFRIARIQSDSHTIQTSHGNSAEAFLRKYLSEFLPKKYGVCSGYIVSQKLPSETKLPQFDIIIYNQLESPILWTEKNSMQFSSEKSRAVPAEYVQGVIEVKSSFKSKTTKEGLSQLMKLLPLLDDPFKKGNLPKNFTSGIVFFELKTKFNYWKSLLKNLIPDPPLRGYMGGLILKGEELNDELTGKIFLACSETPTISDIGRKKISLQFDRGLPCCDSIEFAKKYHISAHLEWSEPNFSIFFFELLNRLEGTYKPGFLSSVYGLSWLNPERIQCRRADCSGNDLL